MLPNSQTVKPICLDWAAHPAFTRLIKTSRSFEPSGKRGKRPTTVEIVFVHLSLNFLRG
nr:MAG TPA_asm: hypothetical protein [Bacteriophage sp.]